MTKQSLLGSVSALVLSLLLFSSSVSGDYSRPTAYSVDCVLSLPYGQIVQNIADYYDATEETDTKQTLDYFHGTDIYTFRPGKQVTWQVNPVVNKQQCFTTKGAVELTPLIPDITDAFEKQNVTVWIRGQECFDYLYTTKNGQKVATYHFYTSVTDETPLQFHFLGYNTVTGSHYDEYIFDYYNYSPNSSLFPAKIFDKPALKCEDWDPSSNSRGFWNPQAFLGRLVRIPKPGQHPKSPFEKFLNRFGVTYGSETQRAEREKNFMRNYLHVQVKNDEYARQGLSTRLELNRFADMDARERAMYTGAGRRRRHYSGAVRKQKNVAQVHTVSEEAIRDLPKEVDWRNKGAVTPVKDQGPCGSCWSFGTTGTIEGHYFLKYQKLPILSQQELVDCSWPYENYGCDGGEDTSAYEWIMANGGLSTEASYGSYLAANGWCGVNRTVVEPLVKLSNYVQVEKGNEHALMDAIANKGPTSVSIDASLDSFSFYSSGVYYDAKCKKGYYDLDHTVLAVGYGTTEKGEDYWIIKNSWSTYWGDDGYILMSRKNNNCGVATDATYPILK